MEAVPTTPEPAPAALSEFARISGALTGSSEAYADIGRRPRWIIPILISIAISLVVITAYSRHIGWEQGLRTMMEKNTRLQNLPPEQRAQVMDQQLKIIPYSAYGGAVLGTPVVVAVTAAALMFLFNMLYSAGLKFGQLFGVTAYAFLTGAVGGILAVIVMYLKPPDEFDLQSPLAFNVGAFLSPETTSAWLRSIGSSIDLFSLWTIFLLGAGIAAVSGKLKLGQTMTGLGILWLIWVVCKAGFSAIVG
jgi:hypothetical protein